MACRAKRPDGLSSDPNYSPDSGSSSSSSSDASTDDGADTNGNDAYKHGMENAKNLYKAIGDAASLRAKKLIDDLNKLTRGAEDTMLKGAEDVVDGSSNGSSGSSSSSPPSHYP